MAVAANLLVGDTPLASPELALVDAELAAQLRRTLGPVEDSWPRPPARVEDTSAESESDDPAQLKSADDGGHAESHDAEQLHGDEPLVSTPEQMPAPPHPLAGFDEALAQSEDDPPSRWDVADILREAQRREEQLLVDECIVAVPEQTPVNEQRSSHYPVLPAPEQEREVIEKADAALRRIRERLNESDESPARTSRLRRRGR